MVTAIIVLSILLVASLYGTYNLLKKIETYEDIATTQADYIFSLSTIISEMDQKLSNPQLIEAFSSDDEIGWFFDDIRQVQDILNEYNRLDLYGEEKKEEKE